ncbi:hypothetical protein [Xanthomonas translucens]|uniref:hypothetical protein n=1 Tax=Xanthomonas campestris pv. translucens TaxID=343 RepID=UPI0011B26DE9|nr:hypothetical protein [Xanthomonas translucens]MCT8318212.1 hypothetical protein [Xanthomonas translucens pv. undulosa]QSQ52960.1 hypothetical protein ISN36_01185 [Xanthomonas translucens pv. undulosa]QSQ61429.1 hypothetical protein ISN38_07060 [Xanthomonas translucens pv. undulosa]WLA12899.1 hypothetical protein MO327_03105 [Xanthomonas translucens]
MKQKNFAPSQADWRIHPAGAAVAARRCGRRRQRPARCAQIPAANAKLPRPNRAAPAMRSEAAHRKRNQQRPITGRRVQGEIGQDGRLQARIPGRQ